MSGRDEILQRFTRVNLTVWLIVLISIGWGVVRQIQGAFRIGWGELLLLISLAILSVGARTWVGRRVPHAMFQFALPLAVFDAILITLAVKLTGGYHSPAWLLYFALLTSESAVMSSPALLTILALTGIGYGFAVTPIPRAIWVDFVYRLSVLSGTVWLMHLVLHSHVAYQREVAQLREDRELLQERERIAQEFHDGLGAALSRVIMGLEAFCRGSQKNSTLNDEQIHYIQELIVQLRSANYETRLIIRQLEPSRGIDVREQVHLIAQRIAHQLGATLHFEAPAAMPNLRPFQSLMVVRIMQEALTNILKHAPNTCQIWVSFRVHDNKLFCCVGDDGDGFDTEAIVGGFGLQNIQERVETLNGQCKIESTLGKGTRIEFHIPLEGGK